MPERYAKSDPCNVRIPAWLHRGRERKPAEEDNLKHKHLFFTILLIMGIIVSGCDQSTPAPAIIPNPLPDGWRGHMVSGFYLALPEKWKFVDVDQEGVESILNMIKGLNSVWTQDIVRTVSPKSVQDMMKFWAMDAEPAGIGYATVTVLFTTTPLTGSSQDVCAEIPSSYKQMDVEVLDTQCSLEINNLDVIRLKARSGPIASMSYQYFYIQGRKSWILSLSVEETEWAKYQPVFETIAESFMIGEFASTPSSQPKQADGICWTRELKDYSGNRSDVWNKYLDDNMKKMLPYDQFTVDVTLNNPQLSADGYVFYPKKTYLLPELCP
jgi:hypothetical protein